MCFLKYIVFTTPSEFKDFGINADFFFKCEQLLICSFHCWFIHLFYKKNRQTNPAVGNDRENSNMFDIVLRSDWAPQTMSQICAQSHPNQGPGWLYKVPSVCGHARVHHHVPRPFCGQWEVHEVCPRGISVRYLWVDILDLVLVIFPPSNMCCILAILLSPGLKTRADPGLQRCTSSWRKFSLWNWKFSLLCFRNKFS